MGVNVTDVTDVTFVSEVTESDLPVLVDFWAPWCTPCRVIGPQIDRLAAETAGTLKVVKVDVAAFPQIARDFGVTSIPVLMVFHGGKVVAEKRGAAGGLPAIKELVAPHISSPPTP